MKKGCSKEQPFFLYKVQSIRYHVPWLLQAGKILQKYHLGQITNPYFTIPKSALDIRHLSKYKVTSIKYQDVKPKKYRVPNLQQEGKIL